MPDREKPVEEQAAAGRAVARAPAQAAASAVREPAPAGPAGVLAMQRGVGNQAVMRLLEHRAAAPRGVQAKLVVGAAGDPFEREADRVAEQVMRTPDADPAGGTTAPPVVEEVVRDAGRPLDAGARAFLEPRFGHDFGGVRVHTDSRAAESAGAVHAQAYTVGPHVVFGEGKYAPGSESGMRLLAHELTHVVQQGAAAPVQRSRSEEDEEAASAP